MLKRKMRIIIGAAVLAGAAVIATVGVAGAGDLGVGDSDDRPINAEARPRAEAAALEHTGGGQVTESEEGDEESLYEVEVTRPDRSAVEVHLDKDFTVVGEDVDDDGADVDDEAGDVDDDD